MELHSDSLAVLLENLGRRKVGHEVDLVVSGRIKNLFVGPHVIEASSENYSHSFSTDSESRPCAIQSSISDTQNDDMTIQLEKFFFTFGHLDVFTNIRQEGL